MKSKLKIIIPVAIVAVIAIVAVVIFMNKEENGIKEIKVGEAFISEDWEYTVDSIEYDYILQNTQSVYLMPYSKYIKQDYSNMDLAKEKSKGRNPYCSDSKDNKYVVVTMKYKYNGKQETSVNFPIVTFKYDGYTIKTESDAIAYSTDNKDWYATSGYSRELKPIPGQECAIYFRVIALLPISVIEDSEKPLVLNFYNKFNINVNNAEVIDYTK